MMPRDRDPMAAERSERVIRRRSSLHTGRRGSKVEGEVVDVVA